MKHISSPKSDNEILAIPFTSRKKTQRHRSRRLPSGTIQANKCALAMTSWT